jgi:reactive chlorine resistance protein C
MRITARGPAMVRSSTFPAVTAVSVEHPVAIAGRLLVRYGLVVVIAWIGALKYTSYEAAAIQPLIAHSPLLSWLYHIVSVRALAAVLGTTEILAALLIALRPVWPRVSAAGSAFGVLLFAATLSFLVTTPGVPAAGGFPVLSVLPGQFLLKDIVLIGAALWTLGDSSAPPGRRPARPPVLGRRPGSRMAGGPGDRLHGASARWPRSPPQPPSPS